MRIVDVLVFKILAIVSSVVLQIILAEIVETVAVIRQVLARETKKDCFGWTHSNQKLNPKFIIVVVRKKNGSP